MADWIELLAHGLGEDALSEAETTRLLGVSREVAHRVERKITPLSTFLLGAAVGRGMAGGATRDQALRAALDALESILPEAPADETG